MRQRRIISADFTDLQSWLDCIEMHFETEGEVIYTGRNLIKKFENVKGETNCYDINVKRYHSPKWINALVYSLGIRSSKGVRAYEYARILTANGISTPEPIAYIENRNSFGIIKESYLVTVHVKSDMDMYAMGNAVEGTYEQIAKELAAFTADMHEKRIMHKDYTPGNILIRNNNLDKTHSFILVDINRMYFGDVTMKMACKNLCRLWGPKRFMQLFIEEYAVKRNFDKDEAKKLLMLYRAKFWKRFQKKHPVKFKLEL